jgi:hypothetical protein
VEANHAPQRRIVEMITGYRVTQAIYVMAKLKIADVFAPGPMGALVLAKAVNAEASPLYRMLRMLSALGLLEEYCSARFSLTSLGQTLCGDTPGSMRSAALYSGDEAYQAFGELSYAIETGNAAFPRVFRESLFTYFSQNPARRDVFFDYLGIGSDELASRVADAYHFSGIEILADVGGGNGALLRKVLAKNPAMRGLLCELSPMIERAGPPLAADGLIDRCSLHSGDFQLSVPGGADAYVLSFVIHDWDAEGSLGILQNCRNAVGAGGGLIIVEEVAPFRDEPSAGTGHDISTLVMSGGFVRTSSEYENLLKLTGFETSRFIPLDLADTFIIEASPDRQSPGDASRQRVTLRASTAPCVTPARCACDRGSGTMPKAKASQRTAHMRSQGRPHESQAARSSDANAPGSRCPGTPFPLSSFLLIPILGQVIEIGWADVVRSHDHKLTVTLGRAGSPAMAKNRQVTVVCCRARGDSHFCNLHMPVQ